MIDYASPAFIEEGFPCDNENLLTMVNWIYFKNELFFEEVILLVTKINGKYFPDAFVF